MSESTFKTNAYNAISSLYGYDKAERSKMPFMKHIDDGLSILDMLGSSVKTKDAFCIHPMIQNDNDLILTYNDKWYDDYNIESSVMILAFKYREIANSYLSKKAVTLGQLHMIKDELEKWPEVREMLIADKVQNKFDFMAHHFQRHERSTELLGYFDTWLNDILCVDYYYYNEACTYIIE